MIDGALRAIADRREQHDDGHDPWWLSRPAVEVARHCRQWPDSRNGLTLYLLLRGETPERIAEMLGLDLREVEASLFPSVAPIEASSDLDVPAAEARRIVFAAEELARSLLAQWRSQAAMKAAAHASEEGRDDLEHAAQAIERESWARTKIHWKRYNTTDLACREEHAFAWHLGVFHARAAVGLEVLGNEVTRCAARALWEELSDEHRAEIQEAEEQLPQIPGERLGEASFDEIRDVQRQRDDAVARQCLLTLRLMAEGAP